MSVLRSITCVALLLLLPATSPVQAQTLSLWGDEAMTACDVLKEAPYQPFDLYVFLEPGAEGAFAVEYRLWAPPGHFSTSQVISPVVSGATIGVWYGAPGIIAPFTSCQNDLLWVCQLTMMSPDTDPNGYFLLPHAEDDFCGVAICPGDRPLRDAWVNNCFGFNVPCWHCFEYSNEETSWGAIKEMHK